MHNFDLENLLTAVRACNACKDLPYGPRPVIRGHQHSRILIVGQAPGIRVHKTGIPWNDPSGDRLRQWMGIDRDAFYNEQKIAIIPMGFCYPGTGKSGDLPPRKECAELWMQKLLASLPNIKLTILAGQYSQAYFLKNTKKKNLTQTVRAWKEYWPNFLPLPHPSPRNNIWLKKNPWFEKEILSNLKERVFQLTK